MERKKPENIRASTGFEPVTSVILMRWSTDWAVKPHIGNEVNFFSSYLPVQWNDVKYIWNSYLYCGCRSGHCPKIFFGQSSDNNNPRKLSCRKVDKHHSNISESQKLYTILLFFLLLFPLMVCFLCFLFQFLSLCLPCCNWSFVTNRRSLCTYIS